MNGSPPPSVFDDFPLPPASKLLGWTLRDVDVDRGTIEISFTADDRFVNPAGNVQGGFLAAMLDDTQGPARPGRFVGKGRVGSRGKTIVFTEAELFDEAGDLAARATFSARVMSGEMAKVSR